MFTAIALVILSGLDTSTHYTREGYLRHTVTLRMPATEADMQEAYTIIHSTGEPRVYHADALRRASVQLGLLEPGSVRFYFRGDFENATDLALMRHRAITYAEFPDAGEKHKFPPAPAIHPVILSIKEYRQALRRQRADFPDFETRFDNEDARADWFEQLYGHLMNGTRQSLAFVRDHLTEEEWAMGLLPLWIPQAGVR